MHVNHAITDSICNEYIGTTVIKRTWATAILFDIEVQYRLKWQWCRDFWCQLHTWHISGSGVLIHTRKPPPKISYQMVLPIMNELAYLSPFSLQSIFCYKYEVLAHRMRVGRPDWRRLFQEWQTMYQRYGQLWLTFLISCYSSVLPYLATAGLDKTLGTLIVPPSVLRYAP